jgi:hypothetical protein
MRAGPDELEAAIDRLYQLPVAEFTDARNALAAELKTKGDKDAAARVKGLGKPTAVAWAVNQVYWGDRARWDALVTALAEVAAAQREALGGAGAAALRDATRRKAERLQEAVRAAERALVASGGAIGLGVQPRLSSTLEALASPRPPDAVSEATPGRLASELQPRGFDVALGLGSMDLPPVPQPRPAAAASVSVDAELQQETAKREKEGASLARAKAAEFEVARLRREVEAAARLLREAESRAEAARAELDGLEARLPPARARAAEKKAAEDAARAALDALRASLAEAEASRGSLG